MGKIRSWAYCILLLVGIALEGILIAQPFDKPNVPAYYTYVSKQVHTLIGGTPNRVFIDLSGYAGDSVRFESEDLTVVRDTGNWFWVTPTPYKRTDKVVLRDPFLSDDPLYRYDSAEQKFAPVTHPLTVADSVDAYETMLKLYHYKLVNKKYVLQHHEVWPRKMAYTWLSFDVIPSRWQMFVSFAGLDSGSKFSLRGLSDSTRLAVHAFFKDDDLYYAPVQSPELTVVSFDFIFDTEDGDINVMHIQADRLTARALQELKRTGSKQSVVTFENIRVLNKASGRVQKVPSLVYYLN